MLWWLLGIHVVGIGVAALAGRVSMRHALVVAAGAPAATALWALSHLHSGASDAQYSRSWVAALDLGLHFRIDAFAMVMTAIVSGVGALVFIYAAGYFEPHAAGACRFPAVLLAFSTSMLGLVLADSVWTLFIFWELTSVTSFLLVGHKNTDLSVQLAARRALMITGGGGLALLAGLMLLTDSAGTASLSNLEPVAGTRAAIAAALLLAAVASKSAQVPLHVWLPGAMAAPTPVSAYLHSATMVKAGIVLMAVTHSAFVDVAPWKVGGLVLGVASMWWGAIGALRQRDAKLILAWGTISQLGLLVTLLSLGSPKAVFAATSIVVAHALFKASLFMIVGEIDIRTGTRDIAELGNLYRTMPVATVAAVLAGASMAGLPPLLGFVAKEAAIEAALGLDGVERVVALVAIVGGSVLTVAYTVRFLWVTFGPGPATTVRSQRPAMALPAVALAIAGVVGFLSLDWVNSRVVVPAAGELDPKSAVYVLKAWPGFTTGLWVSAAVVLVGSVLGALLARRSPGAAPAPRGAQRTDTSLDAILDLARMVTARVQHGSLPVYVATMAATAVATTAVFLPGIDFATLTWWDHPMQMLLALAIAASALAGAFITSRLGAALSLGSVGIGMTGIFVLAGAPDLALTQLLIETIIVVGFVIGLGHLRAKFPTTKTSWQSIRIAVSVAGSLGVVGALAATSSRPAGRAPVADFASEAVTEGGGNNVVNVILTDMRALDTLGEVVVLATVAIGIIALAQAGRVSHPGSAKAHEGTAA